MNAFTGTILFLAIFAWLFTDEIGQKAGALMNAFQAERMACDPDHWEY